MKMMSVLVKALVVAIIHRIYHKAPKIPRSWSVLIIEKEINLEKILVTPVEVEELSLLTPVELEELSDLNFN